MATQTKVYTYVTTPSQGTQVLVASPDNEWLDVELRLETAGPVVVGTDQALTPLIGGPGRILPANQDIVVRLSPGTRLYILSDTADRVSVQINAVPGLEQLLSVIQGSPTASRKSAPTEVPNIGSFGFTMPAATRKR
jgi:hypothetical protein